MSSLDLEQTRDSLVKDARLKLPIMFLLLLLCSLILRNTTFPEVSAYVAIVLAYFIGIFIFISYTSPDLGSKRWPLIIVFAFIIIVFINSLIYPSIFNLIRLFALISFTMLNFYMIPSVVRFDHFLYVMSRIGVVLIIIGSLPLLGLPTQFGFIDVSLWGYFSAFRIPIITSVFVNPNQLGFFLFVGTIGAFREQYFSESSVSTVLLSINTIGLISSHYRAGWMALLAALGLWYTYIFCGRQGVVTATISGIATIAIGLGLLFGVIPGPQTLTDLSLNGRRELWTASIHVLQNNVLTGKGFLGTADIIGNPHNSYLRMFTSFGLIGGFSYTLLVVGVTVGSAREAVTAEKLFLAMLLVGFVLVQLFNQLSFVGLSMRSSIIAMFMGYYIVDE